MLVFFSSKFNIKILKAQTLSLEKKQSGLPPKKYLPTLYVVYPLDLYVHSSLREGKLTPMAFKESC